MARGADSPDAGAGTAETVSAPRDSVARNAGIVASGTLVSRLLGAARESFIAAYFPLGATDAFFLAFTIPNALRALLAEGAASAAVVPLFTEAHEKEGFARARRFYASLSGVALVVLAAVAVCGVAAAPWLASFAALGYRDDPEKFALTATLTQLVFPYIFFMGLAALGMGALNSLRRFAVPAFAPALLNVAFIVAPFTLVGPATALGLPPIGALGLAALAGGVLQVVAQWPALRAAGLPLVPGFDLRDPYVRKAGRLLVPMLAGFGVYYVNVILGQLFASMIPTDGARSFLNYGQRLVEIPQGMFAFAIASASLPALSSLRERGQPDEVKAAFRKSLRLSLFVSVPATLTLCVLAEPIVAVLLGRGEFAPLSVRETTRSLVWQAAGIWAVASVRTVLPMFFAHNDTRSPVICSAVNLATYVALALGLMGSLGHVGLAIAMSSAAAIQLLALLVLLRRRTGPMGLSEIAGAGARTLAASAIAVAVGWGLCRFGVWSRGGNDVRNIAILVTALVATGLVYLLTMAALRAEEVTVVMARIRRRAGR